MELYVQDAAHDEEYSSEEEEEAKDKDTFLYSPGSA